MIKHHLKNAIVILPLVFFFSCATTNTSMGANWTQADLFGMVYDGDGAALGAVSVSIDGKKVAESDSNGRFACKSVKRGKHEIAFSLEGYESSSQQMDFLSRTDVFYVKMYSASQLVGLSLDAYRQGNETKAREYAVKASTIDGGNAQLLFLQATFAYKDGEYQKSLEILDLLESQGTRSPLIDLLRADIYQYGMKEPEKTVEFLKRYLRSKDDILIRKRLDAIGKNVDNPLKN